MDPANHISTSQLERRRKERDASQLFLKKCVALDYKDETLVTPTRSPNDNNELLKQKK
jgi:hypothetical protein